MGDLEGRPLGPCKHCGDAIVEKKPGDRIHVEGPGRGLHNCQSSTVPYGHHAEPVGEECRAESPNPCLGSRL